MVTIETHYGTYTYTVERCEVRDYQDTTTYDFTRTDENLILYTCYPFDALGFTLTATLFMPATHPARSWMLTVEEEMQR